MTVFCSLLLRLVRMELHGYHFKTNLAIRQDHKFKIYCLSPKFQGIFSARIKVRKKDFCILVFAGKSVVT